MWMLPLYLHVNQKSYDDDDDDDMMMMMMMKNFNLYCSFYISVEFSYTNILVNQVGFEGLLFIMILMNLDRFL